MAGATLAATTMFLAALSDWAGVKVNATLLLAASRSVAPAAMTSGELVSSGLAVCPAATVYVPEAVAELANGVIVTVPPLLRLIVRLPPASVAGPSKFTVTLIVAPGL